MRDPAPKEYLARKQADGKTTKGALRSLKRHLARHFHRLLAEPAADHQPAADRPPMIEPPPPTGRELPAIPPTPSPRRPVDPNINGQAPFSMACIS